MKILHYYLYDMKLKYKLLLSYLFIILIPVIVICAFFRLRFMDHLRENTLAMERTILSQTSAGIESYMNQIAETAETAAQSEILQRLLTASDEDLQTILTNQKQSDSIVTYLENIASRVEGNMIQNIRIYCSPDLPLFQYGEITRYGLFDTTDSIDTSLWYGIFQRENAPDQLAASPLLMNSSELEGLGRIALVKRTSCYIGGEKKEAYVAVYFNYDLLADILNGYGKYSHSCIYLLDEKDCPIALTYEDEMKPYVLFYKEIEARVAAETEFSLLDYGDLTAWTAYSTINSTKWRLVLVISEAAITGSVQRDSILFLGLNLIISVLLCLFVIRLSSTLTGRIVVLKDRMNLARKNTPQPLPFPPQTDEIGELTASYNHMAGEINQLLVEKVQHVRAISRLEMKSLRAQINPHFLYNTLDMISWYAKKGDISDVTESIQSLARFYKLSLNHGELLTTVENEVTLLEKYVELQCRRVHSRIDFVADIPNEMLDFQMPQFILQPIVENSLKHGILEKEDASGSITVTGWPETDRMVLVIADDGVGMSKETLDSLSRICSDDAPADSGQHIGIHNIYARLVLFYGSDGFSMHYTSDPETGTIVKLELAYEMRGEALEDEKN